MKVKRHNNSFIIFILLCLITVGFATLSTSLSINGITKIRGNTWDVYFENVQVKDGSVEADVPSVSDKSTVSFEVELKKPGDFYAFTVDVKNNGSIDAMIESINNDSLTTIQSKYLDYAVIGLKEKALIKASDKRKVTVKVSFKDVDSNDLPSVTESIKLTFSFNAVQADSTAVPGIKLVDVNDNGEADFGELVTVGTERFYVISNIDGEVRALAEWNLLVGNQYDGGSLSPINSKGLQDSNSKGWHYIKDTISTEFPSIGVVAFSNSTYWNGTDGATIDLENSANLINGYLTNYKTSLKTLGLETKEVTLITKSELESLGCKSTSNSCQFAPDWVHQTTYWSRSAFEPDYIWYVSSNNGFSSIVYNYDAGSGVRPVISFSISEF